MKNKILSICKLISIVVLSAWVVFIVLADIYGVRLASAETSAEVLQDLRKDKDFNENDYPYVSGDYSLQVIQIAESSNKELFVYAYQPCHDTYDLVGTKISISYGYSVNGAGLTPKLYNLKLISTSGTLDKYYVDGFTVPNDGDRYYNIVEIFRMVHSDLDEIDESFPKTDIAYSVGQQWYACDLNGSKHYEMNTFDTLSVETVFTGNFYFRNGVQIRFLQKPEADCWFYCFNVDEYVITHIFDATLNYSSVEVKETYSGWTGESHGVTPNESTREENVTIRLTDSDIMQHSGHGLKAKDFTWNRILSSKEFIQIAEDQDVKITSEQREKIEASQWVFTFLETEYIDYDSAYTRFYTDVYDVGLLQIHFQDISGKYYDLGVVNDLTNPDNIADGIGGGIDFEGFWNMFVKAISLIVGLILLLVLLKFIPPVKKFFKFIIKCIKKAISAPFKFLKSLFK